MSNVTYDELWRDAQCSLDEIIQADSNLQNSKPQKDRKKIHRNVSELYIRYIVICNKLEQCYDQVIQPQKRSLMRKLLDGTLGRILELKHELVEVDLSEYNYCDDVLMKYGILPQEAELKIPTYIRRERITEILERRKFISDVLRNVGALDEIIQPKTLTELEAIRLIQTHERARQGRVRFQFMKEIREMKERSTIKSDVEPSDPVKEITATMKIQKVWRGYITRQRMRKRRIEEMLLIGMVQPSQVVSENFRQAERIRNHRYEKQTEYQDIYDKMLVDTREFVKNEKSAIMEETMRIELRSWINEYFQQTGKIPELPSAESGGSRMILSRQGTESSLSKSKESSSSKESKKSKKSKAKKESDTEKSEDDESDPGIKPVPSNFLPELIQANLEYQDIWRGKDESGNPWQLPYSEIVLAEKTREVEEEVRAGVDNIIRDDIEALQAALDRDKGHKGKRAKKAQKRVRRSGKKSKRKKEKDLTPDRTTESLFEELLTNGIIKHVPEIYLNSFKGEKSYANFELWDKGRDNLPTIGEIRQLVSEYCILPLATENIRLLSPLVRSVLIAGPNASGKKMLVHSVCTELGATLFDITPANIAGKYPGKSGLIMLLHLISKVSRLLQPSIIFMDGAEKPFVKKVAKTDKTDPKRLKKDLPKLVKSFTNEDRVIVIGTSSSPWDGDQKLLYQTYDKVIYIPRPDYGTMSMLWKDLLYKYAGISRQFDTSAMTKICDGFTLGRVIQSISEVMTTKRMVQLRVQPLTHAELVNALSARDPVYKEEEEAFLAWFSKTPTCRKKQKAIELELQKMEEANEKQKKKGKK
ncbi:IQ and AAA domain-containing protein 1 [Fopius arisanus]|uniref:IQ and AAA domain-containing protein 1 n=1 Tax=Fopius arisanus TaxID=64838 RepID=A0A0C9QGF8_9HYME|nr:PREDICTED: IQ and AAA domain-containing protein 1 [Fopius arisanus]XP_011311369.1 PREDICTED: IQ and AAA domain-containing protein 1 [Fopius arisanus]